MLLWDLAKVEQFSLSHPKTIPGSERLVCSCIWPPHLGKSWWSTSCSSPFEQGLVTFIRPIHKTLRALSHHLSRDITKPTMWLCAQWTQISLGIRPVWSESSLCAQWVAKDPSFLHANTLIRLGGCPGRSESSLGAHSFCWFYHEVAHLDRVKRIWYLSPMRTAKVQASLRIRAVSPEPSLLAHTSSESRGTFRQKARSLAPQNGWACAV